jgi:hypothetical protein
MKSPSHALAFLIVAAFLWGVLHLFGLKFTEGDVYPEYSSLRSDPSGAKLLYDSLARMPHLTTSRNYLPLDNLETTGTTVIAERSAALQKIAGAGNRVVAAMAGRPGLRQDALERFWHVRLESDPGRRNAYRMWFAEAIGWRVLEQIGPKILAIERTFGAGAVVLLAESGDFTNESTLAAGRLDRVIEVLGNHTRIVFDEHHLGIAESGSLVSLARQFRLTGFALGLAITMTLWIWRASSAFPPPSPAQDASRLGGRTSHSGLLTLLRRNVSSRDLLRVCWEQWHSANRRALPPEKMERASAVVYQAQEPVAAAHTLHHIIHSKGPL